MSTKQYIRISVFCLMMILLLLASSNLGSGSTANTTSQSIDFGKVQSLWSDIHDDKADMNKDLEFFVSLGSRMTGTSQCDAAANYIADALRATSPEMKVYFHSFNETVCVDYGSSFTILEHPQEKIKIYAFQSNLVVPSTCNFSAPIVYVRGEKLSDFDGVPINGSIVLMEFNTQLRWLDAAMFGAKAVIFIEPNFCYPSELNTKYLQAPFKFPRFYMTRADGERLKYLLGLEGNKGDLHAHVSSKQVWEERATRNVVGIYPGVSDKIYAITAYYDSYSVVPLMDPGANDALGAVSALEMARLFTRPEYKPYYTLMFVFYSGHHQILSGARHFWNDFFWGANRTIGEKVVQITHMQLCTDTESWRLALTSLGSKVWSHQRYIRELGGGGWYTAMDRVEANLKAINTNFGTKYNLIVSYQVAARNTERYIGWYCKYGITSPPRAFERNPNDIEVVSTLFEYRGVSFMTASYYYFQSPIDTLDRVDWKIFFEELEVAIPLTYIDTVSTDLPTFWNIPFSSIKNLAVMAGRVGWFNIQANNYTVVPSGNSALVYVEAGYDGEFGTYSPFRKVVKCGPDGRWAIPGVFGYYRVAKAYAVDDESGNLTYGPDLGQHAFPLYIPLYSMEYGDIGWQVVFKCSTAILFQTVDARAVTTTGSVRTLQVIEYVSGTKPEFYGVDLLSQDTFSRSLGVCYLPLDRPSVFVLKAEVRGDYPVGVIFNTTKEKAGAGFLFPAGTQHSFFLTPIEFAKGLLTAAEPTITKLETVGISTDFPGRYRTILQKIDAIENEASSYNYSKAYLHALEVWVEAQNLYSSARTFTLDVVNTVPFFALVLTPFTIIFVSLMTSFSGFKRVIAVVVTFILLYMALYFLHPGFILASNAPMIVIGIMILILIIPVLAIDFLTFESALVDLTRAIKGIHYAEISRSSAAVLSINLGIQNMKKRRMRSGLLLATIVIIIFALTAFTSMSAIYFVRPVDMKRVPEYPGVLGSLGGGIGEVEKQHGTGIYEIFQLIAEEVGNETGVCANSWYVTGGSKDPVFPTWMNLTYGNKAFNLYGWIGLSPSEAMKPGFRDLLVAGDWLHEEGRWEAVISDVAAAALGITANDLPAKVRVDNRPFTVVGIIDSRRWVETMRHLDSLPVTTRDYSAPGAWEDVRDLMMINFRDSLTAQPGIHQVSIVFKNASLAPAIAERIFSHFDEIYILYSASDLSTTNYISRGSIILAGGWHLQMVPLIISALIILNNMIAAVHERRKEIGTFASIGLSPLHITVMFIAESAVYALVGGLLGYVAGGLTIKLIAALTPIAFLTNYGGGWVTMTLGITMLLCIASSIYPTILGARLVTPSLERAWKPPTKPRGDEWEIPLPFILEDEESDGIIAYLSEFFEQHLAMDAETFSITDLKAGLGETQGKPAKQLSMKMRLAPYTQGLIQDFDTTLVKDPETGKWSTLVHLKRTVGKYSAWIGNNYKVVDQMRKQFLIWRSLQPSERDRYIKEAKRKTNR